MKYDAIQSLLDTHLATVPDLPPLQLENTRNIAQTGQPFSRATLATTEATSASNISTRFGGLYVIDLYFPQDTGVSTSNAMADAVIAHFWNVAQHRLEGDGVIVQLGRAWRESVGRREPFYALQVKVRWHALL